MSNSRSKQELRAAAYGAMLEAWPTLTEMMRNTGPGEDFRFLRVVREGEFAWRAVCGTYSADGTPMVSFSDGEDFGDVLGGMEAALRAGRVYRDRFAGGPGKGEK